MPHYKLTYFSFKGRAEAARQILAVAGVDFEDERVTMESWPQYKDRMPFGQLPVLEEDGFQIPETQTIQRYLAKKFGLAGKTPHEEVLADAYDELHREYFMETLDYYATLHGFAKGDLEVIFKEKVVPSREKFFGHLRRILAKSESGFLLASGLCHVDLQREFTSQFLETRTEYLEGFPEIKKYVDRVRADPRLKKWLETRPVTTH